MSIITLQDLEKLTEKLYGSQQDSSLNVFENNISNSYFENHSKFTELFEFFTQTESVHCQFWIWNNLINLVEKKYTIFTNEEKANFRSIIKYLFENKITKITSTPYTSSKFCLFLFSWVKNDFPELWPTFFKDIMKLIYMNTDEIIKIKMISKFIN
jgi:hypothetical protein